MSTQVFFLQFILASILLWSPVAGQQVNPVTIPSYVIPGSNGDQDCCDGHPELQFIVDTLLNPTRLETLVTDENCQRPADITTDGSSPVTNVTPLLKQTTDSPSTTNPQDNITTNPLVETTFLTSADHPCGPGWRQVAFINMTDPATNCPPGFNETSFSIRTCGRSDPYVRPTPWPGCQSTTFSTGGTPYSRVCGRIRAYNSGFGNGFRRGKAIDEVYVSGIILTHGSQGSREHIWTFAVGCLFNYNHFWSCPCVPRSTPQPSFVGNDYFCDSVYRNGSTRNFFPDNPLWDGQGCPAEPDPYACACERLNPPWFTKTLPTSTTDDIEMRHCCGLTWNVAEGSIHCSTPFDLVELYVQ